MTVVKSGVFVAVAAAVFVAAYSGYQLGERRNGKPGATLEPLTTSPLETITAERTVLYWHDPMYPQHKFDQPGKSPFMDMELVPVYAQEASTGSAISIDPVLSQSLGVRTAVAEMGTFWRKVSTVGTVQFDERRTSVLQSRASGWLERLHLRAVNDPVKRGMPIAEIYAPELLAAQEEYLLLLAQSNTGTELLAAARERLTLLGLSEPQIEAVAASGQAQRRVVLHAPSSGVVTELGAREGAAVAPGTALARIVDLSRVWIVAQVPERQLAWITVGRPAEATVSALTGEKYEGKVEYIYPDVDADTRTVKVRFSVNNPQVRLSPGMVADVIIWGGPKREVLLVPDEAVIRTGERSVVMVEESPGQYRAQEVAVGLVSGNRVEIVDGLRAGERVVTSGQFLIDSEASLRGSVVRLSGVNVASADAHAGDDGPREYMAGGTVKRIDLEAGKVIISHDPVPKLKWPSMTMGFTVADASLLQRMKPEQRIEFRFFDAGKSYRVSGFTVQTEGAAE